MQTDKSLTATFDYACKWNAFLYTFHKIFSTGLTFLLFKKLDTSHFSLYANSHSIIFLVLLWVDCGFKKSLARFLPEYERSNTSLKKIIHKLMLFRGLMIISAIPICIYLIQKTCLFLQINQYQSFILLSVFIFCIEGFLVFLELIYHAYFLHKYFNILNTLGLLTYSCSAFLICLQESSYESIISSLLYSKIIAGFCTATAAYILLWQIKPHKEQVKNNASSNSNNTLHKNFIHHSILMWISTSLKSLTERNAMMPMLTYFLGPDQANIFKIANESALFFYRIALKTIGTNDTAILTQAKINQENSMSIFHHIKQKISILCLGISCIFVPFFLSNLYNYSHTESVKLFFIITLCYLLEVFLSPYERILEVDQQYRLLFKAYIPYMLLLIILFTTPIINNIGLLYTIMLIHSTRLFSAFLLLMQTRGIHLHDLNLEASTTQNVGQ